MQNEVVKQEQSGGKMPNGQEGVENLFTNMLQEHQPTGTFRLLHNRKICLDIQTFRHLDYYLQENLFRHLDYQTIACRNTQCQPFPEENHWI